MAAVEVLHFAGLTPTPPRVEILGFVGSLSARAHVEILDFIGDSSVALNANAGADQTVDPFDRVYLSGAASSGRPELWHWQQTGGDGPLVSEDDLQPSAFVPGPSFVAPAMPGGCTLLFTLFVALTGGDYVASPDQVVITVRPHPMFTRANGQTLPIRMAGLSPLYGITL